METPLKVLFASAEVAPLAKVGGLADVAAALPRALRRLGHDVRLFLPHYATIDRSGYPVEVVAERLDIPGGRGLESANLSRVTLPGELPVFLIGNKTLFKREEIYGYPDDDRRFIFFSRACLEVVKTLDWKPDIVHCNDWHTGLIPNYLKTLYRDDPLLAGIATVFTIHNLAYQGITDYVALEYAGLGDQGLIRTVAREMDNVVNLMARGILCSDAVNTVSPRYAKEILTPEFGERLDPILWLNRGKLFGILNGIDYEVFNPETDPAIPVNYGPNSLHEKVGNKLALQREFGLHATPDIPLVAMVTRLAEQKGLDLVVEVLDPLLRYNPVQFVLLGTGDPRYHRFFGELGNRHPGRAAIRLTFDPTRARRIYAGADMFLMPSRFEPCGLGQMISLRYGTIPIVRRTGGLADTVVDFDPVRGTGNGFGFQEYHPMALYAALLRAVTAFGFRDAWRALMARAMAADHSWEESAHRYLELYRVARENRQNNLQPVCFPDEAVHPRRF